MQKYILYYGLILLIVISIIIFIIIVEGKDNTSKEKILPKNLQTGDLLFVNYKNSLGYFMRIWSGSKWTHIAMIYRDSQNNVYVMETANYINKKGVLFLPINEWLKLNRKCEIGVMSLEIKNKNFNKNIFLENFDKLNGKKLDTFGISWIRLLTKDKYKPLGNRQNITCYELVMHLLQESDVVNKDFTPSSYFPSDIVRRNIPLKSDFKYSKLKALKMKIKI